MTNAEVAAFFLSLPPNVKAEIAIYDEDNRDYTTCRCAPLTSNDIEEHENTPFLVEGMPVIAVRKLVL